MVHPAGLASHPQKRQARRTSKSHPLTGSLPRRLGEV
jgi:hypothetical protein